MVHNSKDVYFSVEKCDLVNYYGLSHGKQIILCVHRVNDPEFLLQPLKETRKAEDNELSDEGRGCRDDLLLYPISRDKYYLAKADLFDVVKNEISMWEQLYEEGLFPYWKPKEGPFEFHENKRGQVAFCRVEKIEIPDMAILLADEGRTNAKIRDAAILDKIINAIRLPVILPSEYERIRERSFKIMCRNINPVDAR